MSMMQQYGDIIRVRFLVWPNYMILHPSVIKHVLQENHQNYNKDIFTTRLVKPLLGQGLITNDGQSWLHQRRLMQPAFHRKRLAAFGMLMPNATAAMLERWQSFTRLVQPMNVAADSKRLPFRILVETLS